MLRTKVTEQLIIEHANVKKGEPVGRQVFLGLAGDWRKLLFPDASDGVFADGYAQTVTFAVLLARIEGIDLESTSLHEVGQKLGTEHSLMGKALQLLTQDVVGDFVPAIDLHLYENFLAEYDPELRKATGTYYTPHRSSIRWCGWPRRFWSRRSASRIDQALRLQAKYLYDCESPGCGGHEQGILDWELTALQRHFQRDDDATAMGKIQAKFYDDLYAETKRPHFFVGNIANPTKRRNFSVLGVYSPPKLSDYVSMLDLGI